MSNLQSPIDFEKIYDTISDLGPKDREELIKLIIKKHKMLRLFVVILDPEVCEKADHVFQEEKAHIQFKLHGEGTANSELLDLLGLGTSNKIITICILSEPQAKALMTRITRELRLRARGNGIAFTLTISGSGAPMLRMMDFELGELIKNQRESEVEKMKTEALYELVLAVVNQGYSEEVMNAAKSAGATGGTVVHARQVFGEAAKVWGISLQGEREIVAIVTKREDKLEIMKAINSKCGMRSEAYGVVISLPIDSVAGLEE